MTSSTLGENAAGGAVNQPAKGLGEEFGGRDRDRTCDPYHVNV